MTKISLSGRWTLNPVLNHLTPEEARGLPADIPIPVPGDIASALLAANLIPDPFAGRAELECLWIGRTDWRLSTVFTIPSDNSSDNSSDRLTHALLAFPVLDTVAEIIVNGKETARSRNMFRPLFIEVTPEVRPGAANTLDVIIRSPETYTAEAAENLPYPVPFTGHFPWEWRHRNLLRKAACHGGWDWGLTLLTGGIYQEPTLTLNAPGRAEYLSAQAVPVPESDQWHLTVTLDYESRESGHLAVSYTLRPFVPSPAPPAEISLPVSAGGAPQPLQGAPRPPAPPPPPILTQTRTHPLAPGPNRLEITLTVESPQLWWPAGHGTPALYELEVVLVHQTLVPGGPDPSRPAPPGTPPQQSPDAPLHPSFTAPPSAPPGGPPQQQAAPAHSPGGPPEQQAGPPHSPDAPFDAPPEQQAAPAHSPVGPPEQQSAPAPPFSEKLTRRIGFRTVEVIVENDEVGRSMAFRVNGRDIFAKGANWIPVDAFPARQTPGVYRRLLTDAVRANMNMIRLWGGGQYENDAFYEICDELGLMIWHDMMFSCSLYPAREDFLAEVDAEIRHQIRRLEHHPAIVIWCGNNENLGALTWFPESRDNRDRYLVDYDRLNEGIIGRAVKELDPRRTWWPSSPSAGEGDYSDCWHDDTKGDMHYWSVWHEGKPFEAYYEVTPRFCSEFGFQSFPLLPGVASFTRDDDRNITSPVMRHHQKNSGGNTRILGTMARYFRMPADFADFLWLSQVQQAWAMRTAVDYWRSRRPVCMGALYWQLNDLWPVASWSGIEYSGSWKLLHYEAARFFAPVSLSLYKKDGFVHLWGLNDTPRDAHGAVCLKLMSFTGEELQVWNLGDRRCPAGSAAEFISLPMDTLRAPSSGNFPSAPPSNAAVNSIIPDVVDEGLTDRFITAEWHPPSAPSPEVNSFPQVTTSLFLTPPRDCELQSASVKVSPGAAPDTLTLETDVPAFFVTPETRCPGRFSDAGFTLLPGAPVTLRFIPSDAGPVKNLAENPRIRHLRSVY